MITRVIQRERPRSLALLLFLGAILVAAGLFAAVALAVVNDTQTATGCDIQVADRTGFDSCTTTAGAIVQYIGDSNESFGSSGTGIFNSFLRVQATPSETGYNTNGTLQFNSKAGNWTKAIKVSNIPQVDCDGAGPGTAKCWELFADINESNTDKPVSLNDLEVWFTDNPNLTGYPFTGVVGTVPQYDFDGDILINDVNQGSGRGDLRYLIPVSVMPVPAGCNYGNNACGTYFLLYTGWGFTSSFVSDGGFEEWKVKVYPVLANPTVTTLIAPAGPYAIGAVLHDTATLTGATADAGGTITYKLFSDNSCTTLVADLTPVAPANNVVNGVVPNSLNHTFNTAGNFWFYAEYSGDAKNNGPVNSGCAAEPLTIGPNAPAAHSTPVVYIKDTLTVTGLTSDATGNVLVGLFPSSDCTGTQIGTDDSFAVSGQVNGTLTASTSNVAVLTGTYSYKITYAGDNNNTGFTKCEERVVVTITSLP